MPSVPQSSSEQCPHCHGAAILAGKILMVQGIGDADASFDKCHEGNKLQNKMPGQSGGSLRGGKPNRKWLEATSYGRGGMRGLQAERKVPAKTEAGRDLKGGLPNREREGKWSTRKPARGLVGRSKSGFGSELSDKSRE